MTQHAPTDGLNGLTPEQYQAAMHHGVSRRLEPGDILFHQGDPAERCYLVQQGRLKLCKLNEQGKEVIIRYVSAGEWMAAAAVLKHGMYPVSALAVDETRVTGWDKLTIRRLLRQYPDIAIHLIEMLVERIDDIQNRYQELSSENVERRIARTLLRLMRQTGVKTPQGVSINMPLSRQNIADYSGANLYTVSRTLSAWEKNGWIHSSREHITIVVPHALVLFAEGQ